MNPTHLKPTIKDVAKRAGVSIATVSRVLNNLPGYSDETRQIVMKAVEETGYQPNAIARGLINKRTQTIGVLLPSVSSSFSSELLHGIEQYANDSNYSVVICNTGDDGNRTLKYLQVLREKQVDGVIFASEALKDEYYQAIQSMGIPTTLVSSHSDRKSVPYVKVDDFKASYDAVSYLIGKGHTRIAMIAGTKEDRIAGVPRVNGYLQALQDRGLTFREQDLVHGDFKFESGQSAMEELHRQSSGITAVFAASDEMAIGALSYAATHGIRIPDDISLIGYDDLKLAEMVVPSLTTIHQPLSDMGALACQKLISMIETGAQEESSIVKHWIIERNTVKAR